MLSKEIYRIIKLIKKSSRHPKLTMILICHLNTILKKEKININFVQESFQKILFLMSPSISSNFIKIKNFDKQIHTFLKQKKNCRIFIFKIKIIILYLIRRNMIKNNFILFELINNTNFKFILPYLSFFLLKICILKENIFLEVPKEYLEIFLKRANEVIKKEENKNIESDESNDLRNSNGIDSYENTDSIRENLKDSNEQYIDTEEHNSAINNDFMILKTVLLLIHSKCQIKILFSFQKLKIRNFSLNSLFVLEFLSYFARKHQKIDEIRKIIPTNPQFLEMMKNYLQKKSLNDFEINETINFKEIVKSEDIFLDIFKNELKMRKNCKIFVKNVKRILTEILSKSNN